MKKSLLFLASAAFVLASCNNDVILDENKNVADPNQPQEISFTAFNNPIKHAIKHAPVEGTDFPSGQAMYVAAYDASKQGDFFAQTTFSEDGTSGKWKGGKYWPLDDATINFLAYTGVPSGDYFNATHPAQNLVITLADNSENQYDLMYACGRGTRARGAAASDIVMNFKHAEALIKFTVKSAADYGTALKLTSIELTDAHYSGTYTITHTGWNDVDDDPAAQAVSGLWSSVGTQADTVIVPVWADDNKVTTSAQAVGGGILVVPDEDDDADDYAGFTINYTLDGNPYTYEYVPASLDVHQAKKYTFAITMTLNEIIIDPEVTDYAEEGSNAVAVQ